MTATQLHDRDKSTTTLDSEGENILLRSDNEGISTLTLNRPAKLNALSEELLDRLIAELEHIHTDPSIRVVVISAAGKAFCAGHDLGQMLDNRSQDYYETLFASCSRMMQRIVTLNQPVIAKVQGQATAAGCQLVATCDLAVASEEDARFAVSGINLGLFCSTPSVALSRNVSRKKAFEMLFTGDFIDAQKAQDWGLINHCVAAKDLDATVESLCASICGKPQVAVKTGKRVFYQQIEKNLDQAYQFAGKAMASNMMDKDAVEGIDAFLRKRKPAWKIGD